MNNPKVAQADLPSYLQSVKDQIRAELNCIAIGTVIAFNQNEQSVTVSINYLRTIFGAVPVDSPATDQSSNKTVSYPQLVKCPLLVNRGGNGLITFPVMPGDNCVLLFNDRDIDTWWTTGSPNSAPNSYRIHDLNDALVFVGVGTQNNPILDYNMNGPEIRNLLAKLSVEDRIKISVAGITLGNTLYSIMTTLINLANFVGDTADAAALAAEQTVLNGIIK